MQITEGSIVIDRPVADVFAFVSDVQNDPTWHTTVVGGRRTSPGPIGIGTTFEGVYDSQKHTLDTPAQPSNFQRVEAVIVEFTLNRALRLRVVFPDPPRGVGARVLGRTFDLTFRFEAVPEGTRVYRGGEIHPMAVIRLVAPLLLRANSGRNDYLLANLKRAIEGRVAPVPAP